jgi:[acyl-carrier-protein] S-malonyltransferase
MGKALAEEHPQARALFERASQVLGIDLAKICFEGPEELLRETRNTQPALFVKSLAVWEVLDGALSPDFVAGHSLGEYSALAVAGALSFEDALRAVRRRGELMWDSGKKRPGTMAAIVGLSEAEVSALCEEASGGGIVQPANLNCPGQIVVSGEVPAVERAVEMARAKGARLAKKLNVSGAFHSALMEDAAADLAEFLAGVEFRDAAVPLISNVTARPVTKAAEIRKRLVEQMTSPVRWEESVRFLLDAGAREFYEIGAGKVLKGLLRSTESAARCTPLGPPDTLEPILSGAREGSR